MKRLRILLKAFGLSDTTLWRKISANWLKIRPLSSFVSGCNLPRTKAFISIPYAVAHSSKIPLSLKFLFQWSCISFTFANSIQPVSTGTISFLYSIAPSLYCDVYKQRYIYHFRNTPSSYFTPRAIMVYLLYHYGFCNTIFPQKSLSALWQNRKCGVVYSEGQSATKAVCRTGYWVRGSKRVWEFSNKPKIVNGSSFAVFVPYLKQKKERERNEKETRNRT